jgi:CRISPR-associated protein Csd1
MPVSHTPQQAHLEITIDSAGVFKAACIVQKVETVIPATEQSAGRVGTKPPPHPLCDKVQYCAEDYVQFGGTKPSFFKEYEQLLSSWCDSEFSHPKARAVLAYVRKGNVVDDLVAHNVLHVGPDGKLLTQWTSGDPSPEIFRLLTPQAGQRDQGNAFIRWQVWENDNPVAAVWEDASLQEAWIKFDAASNASQGLCMVTGDADVALASSHPKRLRHAGDGAKLVSANDDQGFTFRGRFTDKDGRQACGIGNVVTQKAHNALRWLIKRQAYRNGDQVIVTWAVAGKPVPDPWADSLSLILGFEASDSTAADVAQPLVGDVGQSFAKRLKRAIAGYGATLDPTDDIVVMGLDSATPGRMAITFYRELKGAEFLGRIQSWHEHYAWHQHFSKEARFIGAPAPRDIAEAAFGRRLDDKLKTATVERLLPCIVDGQPMPRDLVESTTRRACNRVGLDHWEWEKTLGIACALFRGYSKSQGKEYDMALEENRTSRDYLYGRLLAVADNIEHYALTSAETNRDTMAARLMQRFADRPFSTWRTIELALTPYKSRLRASEKKAAESRADKDTP